MSSVAEGLAKVEPIMLDGEPWYKVEDLCRALKTHKITTTRYVMPGHWKRYHIKARGAWRDLMVTIVDRKGAFNLIVAYSRETTPTHLLMQALPTN